MDSFLTFFPPLVNCHKILKLSGIQFYEAGSTPSTPLVGENNPVSAGDWTGATVLGHALTTMPTRLINCGLLLGEKGEDATETERVGFTRSRWEQTIVSRSLTSMYFRGPKISLSVQSQCFGFFFWALSDIPIYPAYTSFSKPAMTSVSPYLVPSLSFSRDMNSPRWSILMEVEDRSREKKTHCGVTF